MSRGRKRGRNAKSFDRRVIDIVPNLDDVMELTEGKLRGLGDMK